MTETAGETEMGATAVNDYSSSTKLYQVLPVDTCGASDWGGSIAGYTVIASAMKRKKRIWNQADSIWSKSRTRISMTVCKGNGLAVDKWTDWRNSGNDDVINTDVRRWGENTTRSDNVYIHNDKQPQERPAWNIKWRWIIQQCCTVRTGNVNAHSEWSNPRCANQCDAVFWENIIDQSRLALGKHNQATHYLKTE